MAKFKPYVVQDPSRLTRRDLYGKWLVVGPCFGGMRAVGHDYTYRHGVFDGIVDTVILERQLPQFTEDRNTSLQSYIEDLKKVSLANGATPLAIEWLGDHITYSKKEYDIMAEKLKTKKAPAKAAKAEKPAKAKNKGNPEALEKAREARDGKRAEQHARKIKVLVKAKDSGLREGSGRYAKLAAVDSKDVKTVGDALGLTGTDGNGKEFTIDMGAINGMVGRGHIELV